MILIIYTYDVFDKSKFEIAITTSIFNSLLESYIKVKSDWK